MMASNASSQPTCQNCTTSTTPLWRRDEFGAVLCNACGLFLKLHGRPRPISLKTDVIKSRNRVKTMRPDLAPKKKVSFPPLLTSSFSYSLQQQQQQQQQVHNFPLPIDANTAEFCVQNAVAAAQAIQRAAQKPVNGNNEGSDSPISRAGTPSMYNQGLPSFMVDDPYQTGFNAATGPDGSGGSPMNCERSLDTPQTHEQLIAHNSSLKTRVSELEVINELFRGRLSQLEQQEAAARRGQEVAGVEQTQLRTELEIYKESEAQLRAQLEDSHRRENILKRRLDELELELNEARESLEAPYDRPAKKARVEADATAGMEELEPELKAYREPEPTSELQHETELQAEPEPEPEPEAEQQHGHERAGTPASAAGTASD